MSTFKGCSGSIFWTILERWSLCYCVLPQEGNKLWWLPHDIVTQCQDKMLIFLNDLCCEWTCLNAPIIKVSKHNILSDPVSISLSTAHFEKTLSFNNFSHMQSCIERVRFGFFFSLWLIA